MKIACAFIFCIALTDARPGSAQEIHDVKIDRAVLDGYLSVLKARSTAYYFYGLYVDHYLSLLDASDSITINRFLSTPNVWSDQRSILISRMPDLARLNNLQDTVLVYGPRSMQPLVRRYVPPPQARAVTHVRRSLFSRFMGSWLISSSGFSPYRVAYGRWNMPYSVWRVESNPNSLSHYLTQTNTNKYLGSFEK